MKKSAGDIVIDIFVYSILIALGICTLLPLMNVFSKSVSEEWAVVSGKVGLWPMGFQLDTMKWVVTSKQFITSFRNSVIITIAGTAFSILLTAVTAYPLSKRWLGGVKPVLLLYIFTMLFNGGLVPNYLLIKNLHIYNTLWALILPGMINVFNMLVIKNYFETLPESLEESAKLDGASNIRILIWIILPLSTPVLATMSLFYAVAYWNDYFNAALYISSPAYKSLQLYLRDVVIESNNAVSGVASRSAEDSMNISSEGVKAAAVVAATVPILLVYPYLQKYFIKGILIGSVKG